MNNSVNLESYNDVENLSRFTEDTFKAYCDLKLETCKDDMQFIINHCYNGRKMNVCEIGSGNSKLLYALDLEGYINTADDYEVSESRYKFAEKFKEYLFGEKKCNCNNINANILEIKTDKKYDVIIGVDMVLQFIAPLYDNAEKDFFEWVLAHINDNGYLFLELEDLDGVVSCIHSNGIEKSWEEFPEGDVFQYGLYKLSCDKKDNIIGEKIFLERKTMKKQFFVIVTKSYSKNRIFDLLSKYGFTCEFYSYYSEDDETPINERKKLYRVLAKRNMSHLISN